VVGDTMQSIMYKRWMSVNEEIDAALVKTSYFCVLIELESATFCRSI
jgi:hypothetical protein